MSVAVIIPFRERRSGDPMRRWNLNRVVAHWNNYPAADQVIISSDGRDGDAPFNRSAAYNRATMRGLEKATRADVLIFAEADLLVSYRQVDRAVRMVESPGMVVPFSWFMALSESDSERVRVGMVAPQDCDTTAVKGHRRSIGAINVMSRQTLDSVGEWDEAFEGAWYDDDAMKIAFDRLAAPTRFVEGSAYHLFHRSGGRGAHLSEVDRAATSANRRRLSLYHRAKTPERLRDLLSSEVAE